MIERTKIAEQNGGVNYNVGTEKVVGESIGTRVFL